MNGVPEAGTGKDGITAWLQTILHSAPPGGEKCSACLFSSSMFRRSSMRVTMFEAKLSSTLE
uniref:Uncharacterized protein n=1 Tax=Arundo donax TaxID=35708 RepID=A0A0A9EV05_ARUDO